MALTEINLLEAGYTYSDIRSMTWEEVTLRARIVSSLEFMADSKGGGF